MKLVGVTLWSALVSRCFPGRLTSWLHAWLGVQFAQISVLLLLSSFHALSRTAIWIWLFVLVVSGGIAWTISGRKIRRPTGAEIAMFVLVAIPFTVWIFRCMVLPDFSPDGQAYGTARIALWMNYRSVFIHMPTIMVNIFADEWNGELNGLMYAFSAGNLQGEMMGNAEILIVAMLSSMWAARRFGASVVGAILVGLLMATTPAFVGLGAVTKGDLMSCVGVVMAVGTLAERMTIRAVLVALVWLAVAGGAKISVLPGAAIFGLYAIARVWRQIGLSVILPVSLAVGAATVFMSRFIANAFVYHHPFMRVNGEGMDASITTLAKNVALIGERFVGFFPVFPDGHMYATSLAGGFGLAGCVVVIGVIAGWYRPAERHVILGALSLASVLISALLIPSYLWSFRYFLPFVSVIAIMILTAVVDLGLRMPFAPVFMVAFVAIAYFDFGSTFVPGDISTPGGLERTLNEIAGRPFVQMEMTLFNGMIPEIIPASFDAPPRKTIVIFNQLAARISLFAGSTAQNRIYLSDSTDGFVEEVRKHKPDMAVLAGLPQNLPKQFPVKGYKWVSGGQLYNIAVRIQ